MSQPENFPRDCVGARRLARGLLLCALLAVLLVFRHYGITNDEHVQNEYGELLLRYYSSGFVDRSALHYLDLYRYGGAFDLIAVLLERVLSFGAFETRHLLGGLVGVVGLWGMFKLGQRVGGDRVGLLAMLLLLLTPAFIGHSFNNPKDAPFATAMIWSVYAIVRVLDELPRPSWRSCLLLGVCFGMALSVRVGAVLLGPYLLFALLLWWLGQWRAGRGLAALRDSLPTLLPRLFAAFVLAYLLMAVFWPFAYQEPLNPLKALREFSDYPIDLETLYAGHWYPATRLPRGYIATYVALQLPEMILLGLLLGLTLLWRWLRNGAPLRDTQTIGSALLVLAGLFPIVYFMIRLPTAYNGMRHFLFTVPPLAALAALAFVRCGAWLAAAGRRRLLRLGQGLLGLLILIQAGVVAYLHPHEYVYYNLLIGGVKGAEDRWDLDYWGNSMPEAIHGLEAYLRDENDGRAPDHHYRIAICGDEDSARYYLPDYLVYEEQWQQADFLLALTHDGCDEELHLPNIVVVQRFGTPLAVVKDLRGYDIEPAPETGQLQANPKSAVPGR
ncbi:glycosyltransferase family 39 protein [Plasticicumulans acidivorans]|uniref:Dolichyl-phosphate-mannose-protein mannosyltransferase n=1 Tax=Plasticicumulans acidivorans TaxID=886464 RepID=A0A317N0D7_9GAMM|nr:glycosyltransferase family 39 protein [Plasticicumulans acidivorans]PWV65916.1 dolichyl-phosphate-mannose-protein mannosyltransferase [Plasticicumulans acidivorans]